jgi:hypothetical protein
MKTKSHRRRGNALIEMSLMIVPLFGLLFGIVDFGFAIFMRNSLQHAVREGVRSAVTYTQVEGQCVDASTKAIVKGQSMGFLAASQHDSKIKVRYFDPLDGVEIQPPNGPSPGNIVEVAVEGYNYSWLVPLFWPSAPLALNVRSSDRMEGLPAGAAPCR